MLTRIGIRVTRIVGTMWCAMTFGALALLSLPAALASGSILVVVMWVTQTFLQLVLLAVLQFGQQQSAQRTDAVIQETHAHVTMALADLHAIMREVHAIVTPEDGKESP